MESARETMKGLTEPAASLRKNIPGVYDAYVAMSKEVIATARCRRSLRS